MRKQLRLLQEKLERGLLGCRIQEILWSTRHLYRRNWASNFLKTIDHSHREQIVNSMKGFGISNPTILEAGSGPGANLIRLRATFPKSELIGVDINNQAVKTGRKYFKSKGDTKIHFYHGNLNKLSFIESQSVDLILVDAVFMFITPDKIHQVLEELMRCLRSQGSGLLINDYHAEGLFSEGLFVGGRWVHDLVSHIKLIAPQSHIDIKKSTFIGGDWDEYGYLLEVRI